MAAVALYSAVVTRECESVNKTDLLAHCMFCRLRAILDSHIFLCDLPPSPSHYFADLPPPGGNPGDAHVLGLLTLQMRSL